MRRRPRLWLSGILLTLFAAALATGLAPEPGITTPPGEPGVRTADVRDQVTMSPTRPASIAPRGDEWRGDAPAIRDGGARPAATTSPRLEDYAVIDSLQTLTFVPPNDECVIAFDYAGQALADTLAPYTLTAAAWQAIAIAPSWLREALEWKLHLLTTDNQDRIANVMLTLTDPRTLDEVAFQAAYLSHTILDMATFDEELMRVNAEFMYQIDAELQYVEIVDYDLGGGDFYSTTRYRTIVAGDTTTVEIPREMYYWWIVMPKVSDERPAMGSSVYNLFWREYLYYYNDPGYPLLQQVMQPVTVLWDGVQHDWGGGRPFTDTMLAVDAVGNWCSETVPYAAEGDRPIQPNIIAHGHNGNCGELQDLLCAAARTCLIPTLCTMDVLEDHVWCEMWLDAWHPYQIDLGHGSTHIDNPGIAYDFDHGGSKDCSCIWDWRGDGWSWDAIGTYSQTCTLTVSIEDPDGVPVDNANVTIASESYYPPYTPGAGRTGETDQNGTIDFVLGNHQNYYVRVTSGLGNYPPSGYASIITNSTAGGHYYWEWGLTNPMPQLAIAAGTPATEAPNVLEVEYALPYDLKFGKDLYASPSDYYAYPLADGRLEFFVVDHPNLLNYFARQPFVAYEIAEGSTAGHIYFNIPELRNYYVVLSGAEHQGFSTLANVKVRLWSQGAAVPEAADATSVLRLAPNPFTTRTAIRFQARAAGEFTLQVLDATGRRLRTLTAAVTHPGDQELLWDGTDAVGRALPAGGYFLRLDGAGARETRRVTLLR
jgi:hypothetical protein